MSAVKHRSLPPLNAVRAFEAAARHRNFSLSAVELNVTPSAISHQIRRLEQWLGSELFYRKSRPLRLTDEGVEYFVQVSASFDRLSQSTRHLLEKSVRSKLSLTTMNSFASTWLVSRLRAFSELNTAFDVSVSTSDDYVDLQRGEIDVAIRYGSGTWPNLNTDLLFDEEIFPVCSPLLAEKSKFSIASSGLAEITLLHDSTEVSWEQWLTAAGLEGLIDSNRGVSFSHSYLALQAAINGQGIALGSGPLVYDALEDGRLVKPFDFTLPTRYGYFFVYPHDAKRNPKAMIFRQWLLEECHNP